VTTMKWKLGLSAIAAVFGVGAAGQGVGLAQTNTPDPRFPPVDPTKHYPSQVTYSRQGGAPAATATDAILPSPHDPRFPPIDPTRIYPSHASFATSPVAGTLGAQAEFFSPRQCGGSADNPHPSSHVPGQVNVEASSVCTVKNFGPPAELATAVTLYQEVFGGWHIAGSFGSDIQPGVYTVNAQSNGDCPGKNNAQTYIGFGSGFSVEEGVTYFGTFQSPASPTFGC
jgi:hypothetical protein